MGTQKRALYKKEKEVMWATGIKNAGRRPAEAGFTLMEALIALAIFSVGVMGIASLQVSSTTGDLRARLATEAATVAHDQAEKLLSMNFDPDAPTEEFLDTGQSGYGSFPTSREITTGRFTTDWLVVTHPTIPRAVTIQLRTDWGYFGDGKVYELEFVKIADL